MSRVYMYILLNTPCALRYTHLLCGRYLEFLDELTPYFHGPILKVIATAAVTLGTLIFCSDYIIFVLFVFFFRPVAII